MEIPHRIKVKYFLQEPAEVDLAAFTPLFHRWIQQNRVEGMLLDVADYKHVPDGPGILLIGHEADYNIDLTGGRPGLAYDRKRGWEGMDALADRVGAVLRGGLIGGQALEEDLDGALRISTNEAALSILDRLYFPNQAAVYAAVVEEIRPVLDALYGQNGYALAQASQDPRHALTILLTANERLPLATLLARLPQGKKLAATNGVSHNGQI
jgi:hypothetical protein